MFIYLSDYEGFGIPPLEAMAAGTPVITSDKTALKENYSETAYMVGEHSPRAIADAIETVLSEDKQRKLLIRKGKDLARNSGWEKTAAIINREIDRIIENFLR